MWVWKWALDLLVSKYIQKTIIDNLLINKLAKNNKNKVIINYFFNI